jgi:hypothetical protein
MGKKKLNCCVSWRTQTSRVKRSDFCGLPPTRLMEASTICLGAIMLLTKDDNLIGEENFAAPRDNVIFEMGMFMEAKGRRERVLVVREQGAKMPADIGGGIYLSVKDRTDIKPIQMKLMDFIERRIYNSPDEALDITASASPPCRGLKRFDLRAVVQLICHWHPGQ